MTTLRKRKSFFINFSILIIQLVALSAAMAMDNEEDTDPSYNYRLLPGNENMHLLINDEPYNQSRSGYSYFLEKQKSHSSSYGLFDSIYQNINKLYDNSALLIFQLQRGIIYNDFSVSPEKSFAHYLDLAKANNVMAQKTVARMYYRGEGVLQNYEFALEWYLKAAANNDVDAQRFSGEMHYKGLGTIQNFGEAEKLYRKAAMQADTWAQMMVGDMHYRGLGVTQDYSEAIRFFDMAREHAVAIAFLRLGFMYDRGVGTLQDKNKSTDYFKKAFDAKHESHSVLGMLLQYGRGVEQNYILAVQHYRKVEKHLPSQARLGRLYKEGHGVTQDIETAHFLIHSSARPECSEGLYELALLYRDGEGVEADQGKALALLEEAAKYKHEDSLYTLGWMHKKGKGTPKNPLLAKSYYDEGKKLQAEDALYSLGRKYELGLQVGINKVKALKWYKKAANLGYEPALEKLKGGEWSKK